MDLTPTTATKLFGTGRYDAFPVAASNGTTVVGMWRSATEHAVDHSASIMAAISTDSGETYGAPYVTYDDRSATLESSPAGLAWDAAGSRWVMLVIVKRYADATTRTVAEYSARLLTSPDAVSWTVLVDKLPTPGVAWFFASDLAIDGGTWVVAGYGRMSDGVWSAPITTTSTNAGKSWSKPVVPSGLSSVSLAEPQLVKHPDRWMLMARNDSSHTVEQFFGTVADDGSLTWAWDRTIIDSVSGCPEVACDPKGTLAMLLRMLPVVDGTHGTWLWATSTDGGETWDVRADFPDQTLYMMYGGLAPLPDGGFACVYSSEDDPSRMWKSASIYATQFLFMPLTVVQAWDGAVPYVEVSPTAGADALRHTIDPVTGEEVIEEVRYKVPTPGGASRDYELQQGRTAWYTAGVREGRKVTAPILAETVLVHPTQPELSIQAHIVQDQQRTYAVDANVQQVPQPTGLGVQYPIITTTGTLGSAMGTTTIRTRSLVDKAAFLALFSDLRPIFWSHHPGLDLPEWIRLTAEISEERFMQCCSHTVDDPRDQAQWRTWTLKWAEQPRPTADGMPVEHRIRNVRQPIQQIDLPYEDF